MSDLPRVTQILSDCFGRNRFWTDVGRYEGQLVHALLAADNRGILNMDRLRARQPEYVGYVQGWRRIRARFGGVVAVEQKVRTNQYVGRLDVALVQKCATPIEGILIIDFKCGSPLPWHRLQTQAYAEALPAVWRHPHLPARACCYLDPNPDKCKLVPHDNPQDADDWRIMLCYWYTMERLVGWKTNGK
jgi:hypothetical protein